MKNFLRAVRIALPYRGRLILSVVCAVFAAILWGLNFTAIYPVLKILSNDQTVQEWVDREVKNTQDEIDKLQGNVDHNLKASKRLERQPFSKSREQQKRNLAHNLVRTQSQLQQASTRLSRLLIAKKFIYMLVPTDRFRTLALLIGLVVVAVAVKGFFEFGQDSLVGSVVNLSLFDLRNRFYRNVIHLDVNNFGEAGTHELMARFTNDMELLGTGTKALFGKVVAEPLRALACVIIASLISWQLTLMFLVLVPVALFILTKVGRTMKRATRRLLERMSSIYKILQETFQGIRVVKAFTMEPYERRRFCTATKDYYHKAMLVVNLDAMAGPIIELLGVMAVALALLAGAYLVLNRQMQLFGVQVIDRPLEHESLLQLYVLLAAIADPVRKLSSVLTRIQSGAAAADRVFAFLDRQPRVQGNSTGRRLARHASAIEFRDVCFSYEPGRPILTNVHLKVRFGETIAFVGKNGCGKTTLVGLIPRFYDPDHGSILVDSLDIRNVNLRSLRQQVGLVTQETILFDDTIYNNIAYGNRRAPREEVEAAAQSAFAHDFITKLTDGYQTRIGEAGCKLSGGQKQRLALARAILRDPAIFILDEFTSQSDAESEALINRALKDFIRNRTTLVITHRLNTLEIADRIVVVDNGRLDAVGTHQELLGNCPAYQRLHEAQFQRLSA
ncbi:MAG TPA: ABC transporter ATP-binding protein [Gemmataceae bacterium]|jgi:ATP-binding cassette subfamily B protein/subfamily B ATP-binding cassette protein MsbA|nr:ABC transporter ATP-binding protein [Gemmataceae bacterium]